MSLSCEREREREGTDESGWKDGIKYRPMSKLEEKLEFDALHPYHLGLDY